MGLFNTLRYILQHPANRNSRWSALSGYIKWQIQSSINKNPIIYPWIRGTKFLAWKGLTGITGNIYCKLHEFEDMSFVLHYLREGDLFVDVGANVGSYSILAASVQANVYSIEPVPHTFEILRKNVCINTFQAKIQLFNLGVGKEQGTLYFTDNLDTVNHVVKQGIKNAVPVGATTLDILCLNGVPDLIKIDVEGFEGVVLEGSKNILSDPKLNALIVEMNDDNQEYGYNAQDIESMLAGYGFKDPKSQFLSNKPLPTTSGNALFVRDFKKVVERVSNHTADWM